MSWFTAPVAHAVWCGGASVSPGGRVGESAASRKHTEAAHSTRAPFRKQESTSTVRRARSGTHPRRWTWWRPAAGWPSRCRSCSRPACRCGEGGARACVSSLPWDDWGLVGPRNLACSPWAIRPLLLGLCKGNPQSSHLGILLHRGVEVGHVRLVVLLVVQLHDLACGVGVGWRCVGSRSTCACVHACMHAHTYAHTKHARPAGAGAALPPTPCPTHRRWRAAGPHSRRPGQGAWPGTGRARYLRSRPCELHMHAGPWAGEGAQGFGACMGHTSPMARWSTAAPPPTSSPRHQHSLSGGGRGEARQRRGRVAQCHCVLLCVRGCAGQNEFVGYEFTWLRNDKSITETEGPSKGLTCKWLLGSMGTNGVQGRRRRPQHPAYTIHTVHGLFCVEV